MLNTNLGENIKIKRKLGDSLELKCEAKAIPIPIIEWYKDDIKIDNNYTDTMSTLIIPYLRPEDEGQYKCVVSNRLGSLEEIVTVKITSKL